MAPIAGLMRSGATRSNFTRFCAGPPLAILPRMKRNSLTPLAIFLAAVLFGCGDEAPPAKVVYVPYKGTDDTTATYFCRTLPTCQKACEDLYVCKMGSGVEYDEAYHDCMASKNICLDRKVPK
jgi:hypothetical protein